MKNQYAIFNSATGLYSAGYTDYIQSWGDLTTCRLWDTVGNLKAHIRHCNNLAKCNRHVVPYDESLMIVEITVTRNQTSIISKVNV